jgi:hypothetical protein
MTLTPEEWRRRALAAEEAVKANHAWHLKHDDTGTYEGSDLHRQNMKVVAAIDERVAGSPRLTKGLA